MAVGDVTDLGMNGRAWRLADSYAGRADELRIGVRRLAGGARVIDAGVDAAGGLAAGLALARLCLGGLGHVAYASLIIDGETWPGVQVWTDHPAAACMASQYAGWAIARTASSPWAPGRCARWRASSASCSSGWATRRTPGRASSCSKDAGSRPTRWPRRLRQSRCGARRPHAAPSRRRRASPAACRLWPGSSRPACTRWTPSASTSGASSARWARRRWRRPRSNDIARDRAHQRLRALRRGGALTVRADDQELAGSPSAFRRRLRPTTERRSGSSSSATTTTSTRSIPCCSARPRCGSRTRRAGVRSTPDG